MLAATGIVAALGVAELARGRKVVAEEQRRLPPAEVAPLAAGDPIDGLISMDDVASHNSPESGLWVVINGEVYE